MDRDDEHDAFDTAPEAESEPSKVSKVERLLSLVALLLRAKDPVPWAEIRRTVAGYQSEVASKVLERRFSRDKQDLRRLGVPVDFSPGRGYSISKTKYFLEPMNLGREDAILLRSLATMAEFGPMPEDEIHAAVQKFACDTGVGGALGLGATAPTAAHPRPVEPPTHEGDGDLLVMVGPSDRDSKDRFREMSHALGERRVIRFPCAGVTQAVEPYGLGFADGAWSLVGRCRESRELRAFRLDRIQGAVELERPLADGRPEYELPDSFDVGAFLRRPRWLWAEGTPLEVEVEFSPSWALPAKEALSGHGEFQILADGGGVMKASARSVEALVPWLLERLPHIRRAHPSELVDRLVAALDGILELYPPEAAP